jgi:hypothetical protein
VRISDRHDVVVVGASPQAMPMSADKALISRRSALQCRSMSVQWRGVRRIGGPATLARGHRVR